MRVWKLVRGEVAEVEIVAAAVEGELESAEGENPPEVRIVVSCTIHSPSTASWANMLRTGTPSTPEIWFEKYRRWCRSTHVYFDKILP